MVIQVESEVCRESYEVLPRTISHRWGRCVLAPPYISWLLVSAETMT